MFRGAVYYHFATYILEKFLQALLLVIFLLPPHHVKALSCAESKDTPLMLMQRSDAVFIGTILSSAKQTNTGLYSTGMFELAHVIQVDDAVKGVSEKAKISVYVDKTWGSTKLVTGKKYLMILTKDKERFIEPLCQASILAADSESASPFIADFDKVREQTLPKGDPPRKNYPSYLLLASTFTLGVGIILGGILMPRAAKRPRS